MKKSKKPKIQTGKLYQWRPSGQLDNQSYKYTMYLGNRQGIHQSDVCYLPQKELLMVLESYSNRHDTDCRVLTSTGIVAWIRISAEFLDDWVLLE